MENLISSVYISRRKQISQYTWLISTSIEVCHYILFFDFKGRTIDKRKLYSSTGDPLHVWKNFTNL